MNAPFIYCRARADRHRHDAPADNRMVFVHPWHFGQIRFAYKHARRMGLSVYDARLVVWSSAFAAYIAGLRDQIEFVGVTEDRAHRDDIWRADALESMGAS